MVAEEYARDRFSLRRTINLITWRNYLCAGAAAGAAGGVFARVAMRLVALISDNGTVFTVSASLGIVMIFAIVGIAAGVVWMVMAHLLHLRPGMGGLLLAIGLMLLAAPIFEAARSDLPSADTTTILKFLLLFVPVPLTIGWGTTWGAARLQKRAAHARAKSMPMASALAALVLFVAAIMSVVPVIGAPQRHPLILSELLQSNAADFAAADNGARAVTLLIFMVYIALLLIALWRQPDNANVQRCVLLALALPTLLLTSGVRLPAPLAWLPNARGLLGLVQAAGLAALLGLFLTAGGFAPPRRLVGVALATWATAALWLMARPQARWTEWVLWSMLAATFACITVWRLRNAGGTKRSTPLLALFALCWLALWAAIMVTPALQLRLLSGFAVTRVVTLFWLPWLLLPAALLG